MSVPDHSSADLGVQPEPLGRALRGRSTPYGTSTPYSAFAHHVKQIAGIFDTDSIAAAEQKLAQTVAALLESDDVAEVTSQLAMLVGLESGRAAVDRPVAFFAALAGAAISGILGAFMALPAAAVIQADAQEGHADAR